MCATAAAAGPVADPAAHAAVAVGTSCAFQGGAQCGKTLQLREPSLHSDLRFARASVGRLGQSAPTIDGEPSSPQNSPFTTCTHTPSMQLNTKHNPLVPPPHRTARKTNQHTTTGGTPHPRPPPFHATQVQRHAPANPPTTPPSALFPHHPRTDTKPPTTIADTGLHARACTHTYACASMQGLACMHVCAPAHTRARAPRGRAQPTCNRWLACTPWASRSSASCHRQRAAP